MSVYLRNCPAPELQRLAAGPFSDVDVGVSGRLHPAQPAPALVMKWNIYELHSPPRMNKFHRRLLLLLLLLVL